MSITRTRTQSRAFFAGRRMWFLIAGIAALIGAVLTFVYISQYSAQTTYYVVNKVIPARSQVDVSDLTAVATSAGTAPQGFTAQEIQASGNVYAKYTLNPGDILTSSNVASSLSPLNEGLPKNYSVASFVAAPSLAAGGKIQRGTYIDIYAVNSDDNSAHLILQHTLVVDATINLDSVDASTSANNSSSTAGGSSSSSSSSTGSSSTSGSQQSSDAAEDAQYRTGIPSLFTVGLDQQDTAKLFVAQQYKLYVAISADQSSNANIGSVDVGAAPQQVFNGSVGDAGAGTDSTFGDSSSKSSSTSSNSSADSSDGTSTSSPSESPAPSNSASTGTNQ